MQVGIRELKAKLSEHVAQVASSGERIIVTDRGRPVAQLVPLDGQSSMERGIAEGWIEPARSTGLGPKRASMAKRSVAEVLDEDRE